ncbi:MAG TPA: CbiX/SirB N-terminal domain-containing protein, partial [Rhodocyclaceae bacterium]|nr:CbiX/SirB N-terminal domain-containing protein [Rhodocyclaceae bacterium]
MSQGVVLFGHGSRNPAWAEPFHALRAEMLRQQPEAQIELGFLELMTPDLPEAIGRLVAAGATAIVVVPVFISAGSHVREDLPRLIAAAQAQYPGVSVTVRPSLGEAPEMLAA